MPKSNLWTSVCVKEGRGGMLTAEATVNGHKQHGLMKKFQYSLIFHL